MWSKFAMPACSALALVVSSIAFAQDGALAKAFEAGNGLMRGGKFCEALALYKGGLAVAPDDESLLFDTGLAAYRCKDYAEALRSWGRLKTLNDIDWQVRAKLIQTYQALGEFEQRDAERTALFEMRAKNANEDLTRQTEYCREQFEAGGERVMAFEQFELKGPRALRYVFSILDEAGTAERYRVSLGSYDFTNQIWRETTKPQPKDGERLFHLDGYYDWGHATYGMFAPEPSYEDVRKMVIEILEKKREPVSSSRVAGK